MSGLVSELQRACLDSTVRTAEVLQKAYVVARKLGIKEFEDWVSKEIDGYQSNDKIPDYRSVTGQVKVWNPYRGWIPVVADDPKFQELLNNRSTSQALGQLEDTLARSRTSSNLMMSFTPEQEREILGPNSLYANPKLHLSSAVVQGIVDKVRHVVLKWCLDLEAKGIAGEGMTFSEEEKKAAESVQNIQVHYYGSVSQSQVATERSSQTMITRANLDEMKTFVKELREHMEKLQLTADQHAQVLADLTSIESQLPAPKPSSGIIAEAYKTIRNITEGMIGSLIASGVLSKLPPM
jgi:hypothetical protein